MSENRISLGKRMMEKDLEIGDLDIVDEHQTENIELIQHQVPSHELNPLHQQQQHHQCQNNGGDENLNTYDVVTHVIVPKSKNEFFKKWLIETYDEVSMFHGFISRRVHEMNSTDEYLEYVIINIFQSYESFKDWYVSQERSKLMKKLKQHHIQWNVMNAYGGDVEDDSTQTFNHHSRVSNRIHLQNSLMKIPKPLPPPKWKLTIILIVSIYALVVAFIFSGQFDIYLEAGLPKSFIYFFFVTQLVIVNVYALAPLVMEIPFVDKWLRYQRPNPETMNPFLAALDQGLKIFAVKVSPPPHPELVRRIDALERKLDRLREVEYNLKLSLQKSHSLSPHSDFEHEDPRSPVHALRSIEASLEKFTSRKRSNSEMKLSNRHKHKITMAVRHYVKWEYLLEFEDWINHMEAEMNK
jgi:antibiotic biosynthesis monooxygenase (ABM) superfamily enzyme